MASFPDWLRPTRLSWLVGSFFGLLALLGVALYQDYGVGWDEQLDRLNGIINAKYVAGKIAPELARRQASFAQIPDMRDNADSDHGVLYQLPLVLLEKVAGTDDSREVYFLRHLVIWLTCVLGTYVVYRVGARYLGSRGWGLLVAAALVLSPRLFAESFYNYKDVVFIGFFALGIGTLWWWLRRPSWGRAVVHAAVMGAAIDVRTMAVLLPAFTVVFALLEGWQRPGVRRPLLLGGLLMLPVLAAVVVAGWPYLWENPGRHFVEAFTSFRRYRADMLTLYLGQELSVRELPWHYIPIWLLVTTPLSYTVLFVAGLAVVARQTRAGVRAWLRTPAGRQDLLVLAWFFGPLSAIILLRSVVYDGWRHLYFVYPALLLLAGRGAQAAWGGWRTTARPARRRLGGALGLLLLLGLGHTAMRLVLDHPYQNVYFSFLPGAVAEQLFERDYWGLSGREGVEWILAHDPSPVVPVATEPRTTLMLHNAQLLLPPAQRARLRMVPLAQARYFLTTYRWHPGPYPDSMGHPVYVRRVNGLTLLSVMRRPERSSPRR